MLIKLTYKKMFDLKDVNIILQEKKFMYGFTTFILLMIIIKSISYLIVKRRYNQFNINSNKKNNYLSTMIFLLDLLTLLFCIIEIFSFIKGFPYNAFMLSIFAFIVIIYSNVKEIMGLVIIEKQNIKNQNLEMYNKNLTIKYDNVRGFRHDFSNFVQALDGYVRANDMDGIRKMTESVLKDCSDINVIDVINPKIINNPAVYNVIANKYNLAKENDIEMNIEVLIDFNNINICNYELCRILSILLDNAIEAAKECDEKIVNVRFIKDININRELIIVENSYNKVDIDIERIFEKGYTTKANNNDEHGLGLWNVRRILNGSNNLNLFTKKEELFCQQLEIYE